MNEKIITIDPGDHKAAAERLAEVIEPDDTVQRAQAMATLAQVHALLAIEKQLARIADLKEDEYIRRRVGWSTDDLDAVLGAVLEMARTGPPEFYTVSEIARRANAQSDLMISPRLVGSVLANAWGLDLKRPRQGEHKGLTGVWAASVHEWLTDHSDWAPDRKP